MPEYSSVTSMLLMRFIRGFIIGSISTLAVMIGGVSSNPPITLENLLSTAQMLAIAAAVGGTSGALLSLEKGIRYYFSQKYPTIDVQDNSISIEE